MSLKMGLNTHSKLKTHNFKFLTALVSGILMGLTVAPFGAWFLAWLALCPLWVFVVSNEKSSGNEQSKVKKRIKSSFLTALGWGIGYYGMSLSWITGIHPMTWMGVPWLASLAIALFCWSFITLWGTALAITWVLICNWIFHSKLISSFNSNLNSSLNSSLSSRFHSNFKFKFGFKAQNSPWFRVLVGTSVWCLLEAIWTSGPLWWSSLAYTQSPQNLVILHLGQISGTTTITAVIVAVNCLLAEAWIKYARRANKTTNKPGNKTARNSSVVRTSPASIYLGSAVLILVVSHLIGFGLYSIPLQDTAETHLKVGIVQGNVPNTIKLTEYGKQRALNHYTSGYLNLVEQDVDAVLTPEGALPFFKRRIFQSSLVAAVREKGVLAWIGGFAQQKQGTYTNSLFTFTGDGEVFSRYDKAKLVPMGEYVPFREIIGGIVKRLSPLDEHQVPGEANQIFETPFGRAIAVICYGSAFPELFRYQASQGGEFILSPSNDAHFSEAMPAQHHAQDIMRAIETDRWAVRATNTGYSAFVNPHGKTIWISGHNTYEIHAENIYRRRSQTLYVRWGDWLTPVLLGLSFLFFVVRRFW